MVFYYHINQIYTSQYEIRIHYSKMQIAQFPIYLKRITKVDCRFQKECINCLEK